MVQRYESTEWGQMDADSEGGWVSYLAHVAEVQRVLKAARERIMGLTYEIDGEIWVDRDEVIGWIDKLMEDE